MFWRFWLGVGVLEALGFLYLNFLPLMEARKTLLIFDPTLDFSKPESRENLDCRVFTPEHPESMWFNIYDKVVEIHFIAHLAGWFIKVLIFRDVLCCWIASITFEIIELSLKHWVYSYIECWWDHVSRFTSSFCSTPLDVISLGWYWEPISFANSVCDRLVGLVNTSQKSLPKLERREVAKTNLNLKRL